MARKIIDFDYDLTISGRFGAGFFLAGLCPADASQRLDMVSDADGLQKVLEMLLLGEPVDDQEACQD